MGKICECRKPVILSALCPHADQIEVQPPDWLLHGALQRNSLSLIVGDPACGKSLLALDWAMRITTGTPWRGHEVKPAPVFYMAEDRQQLLGRRAGAWEQHNSVKLTGAPLFVSPPIGIADAGQFGSLLAAIDSEKTPSLIVIDSLVRCFGDGDENSSRDMGRFLLACDALRRHYNCTILLLDFGGFGRTPGAMALKEAIDSEYHLEKSDNELTLTAIKMRDAILPNPVSLKIRSVELPGLRDEYGSKVTSAAVDVFGTDTGAIAPMDTRTENISWSTT